MPFSHEPPLRGSAGSGVAPDQWPHREPAPHGEPVRSAWVHLAAADRSPRSESSTKWRTLHTGGWKRPIEGSPAHAGIAQPSNARSRYAVV